MNAPLSPSLDESAAGAFLSQIMISLAMLRRLLATAFTLVLALGASAPARAHDPGLSSATIKLLGEHIDAVVIFNPRDLSALSPDGEGRAKFAPLAAKALIAEMDGSTLTTTVKGIAVDDKNNFQFHLEFPLHAGSTITIRSGLIQKLPFGHREMLTVRNSNNTLLAERLFSAKENAFTFPLVGSETAPAGNPKGRDHTPGYLEFLLLGINHIATGYDHLLFLAALLIVCPNFLSAARIITCFTIAHSITLVLSTLNIVALSSRVVEPMIAASIVYVAAENLLRPGRIDYRWALTFAFGLIHGLGFASVLREMGIAASPGGVFVPLVSFNCGVEIGQLTIASIFLPIVWQLRKSPSFGRIGVPVCSSIVAMAGAYWFIERVFLSPT